jgi:uncharacterized SAM-binding protein YcdF (DUF218 family)
LSDPASIPGAIIIFGAGLRPDGSPSPTLMRRIAVALRFGHTLPQPPLYLPTGGIGRHGPSEARAMAEALEAAGVSPARIILEETATDTLDSVIACRAILRRRGHRGAVFAATSAYHLPRCLVLLRLAGVAARACPPPSVPAAAGWRQRWYWRLRELAALPYDTMLLLGLRLSGRV